MARLGIQKVNLLSILDRAAATFNDLASRSAGEASKEFGGLYGGWVKENLAEAAKRVREIDVEKVLALRGEGQATEVVFEAHVLAAEKCLKGPHGVKH